MRKSQLLVAKLVHAACSLKKLLLIKQVDDRARLLNGTSSWTRVLRNLTLGRELCLITAARH